MATLFPVYLRTPRYVGASKAHPGPRKDPESCDPGIHSFLTSSGKSLSNEEPSQTFREDIGDIYCFPQRFRENYPGLVQPDPSSVTSVGQGKAVGSVGGLQ